MLPTEQTLEITIFRDYAVGSILMSQIKLSTGERIKAEESYIQGIMGLSEVLRTYVQQAMRTKQIRQSHKRVSCAGASCIWALR